VGVVDVTDDCDHQFKKSLMLTANEIGIYHNDGLVIPKNFRFSDEEVRSELSSIVAIAHFFNPSMTDTPFGGVPAEVA
jgi:hypothetical protein